MQEVSGDEALHELQTFMPAFFARTLLKAWGATLDHPALVTDTVAQITGTTARPFLAWVMNHAAEFRASEKEASRY